jgi:hypothetical protein
MRILFFSLIIILSQNIFSQEKTGRVVVNEEKRITELFSRYTAENASNPSIDGYRVQLHFGNDRDKAKEVKTKFLKLYSDIEAYESYQQPNFRIRVGDFRTRLEAVKFQKQIHQQFPGAFVVTDKVSLPKLK